MWLTRPPGVYPPQHDTWLLVEALAAAAIRPGANVLDIGCGTGALSVAAASTRPRTITAVDVSRRAVLAARLNTSLRGIRARIHCGDAFKQVAGRGFDLILANPPYVPGVSACPRGRDRAWDAGVDGRDFLNRLCANAPLLLAPGGTLLVVHSTLSNVDATLHQLRGGGLKAAVVARQEAPFGPVMNGRRDRLRELGFIEPGQRSEELVVIRGDRPATP
ncbi:HemK2/MTQ2 family protein methyltransferase [Actinophytocola sp.]|uniref:HemK2/MTQ2 family protein methyltransferase n=1 Tax=Actinophytocola sp. TaxID=1872138 RepID=UPI002D4B4FA6|nr:HemK2/MTQ2 family protein methyltransferase [Actinophytocola sp.]HYQ64993.1 HemK2/MTQ2 family protein methyltransferase [Actinophytocola sp.]